MYSYDDGMNDKSMRYRWMWRPAIPSGGWLLAHAQNEVHSHTHARTLTHKYINTHTHTHTHTHTQTHIHTYTQAPTQCKVPPPMPPERNRHIFAQSVPKSLDLQQEEHEKEGV